MERPKIRTLFDYLIRIQADGHKFQKIGLSICGTLGTLLTRTKLRSTLQRFITANDFPVNEVQADLIVPTIELLYVAAKKDFEILASTIQITLNSLANYEVSKISIIVPDNQVQILKSSLPSIETPLVVISESKFVSENQFKEIESAFGERYGWVLQQILKVSFVKESSYPGVLVVDADTALLIQRQWLDTSGIQILCPTWENHPPYYKFLEDHGIAHNPPEFTFVSHHMLFQPQILNEVLSLQGWTSTENLLRSLLNSERVNENSPFSIDYELYAQYLYSAHPKKVVLEKWANFEAPNKQPKESTFDYVRRITTDLRSNYASVSFHSYLS